MSFSKKQTFLLIGDWLVFIASLYLTLSLRYLTWPDSLVWQNHFTSFALIFFSWNILFYIAGLYSLKNLASRDFFSLFINSLFPGVFLAVLFFYTSSQNIISPKTNLLIFTLIFIFAFWAWRNFFIWFLKKQMPKNTIIFLGRTQETEEIVKELKNNPQLGFEALSIFDEKKITQDILEFKKIIFEKKPDYLILGLNIKLNNELRDLLFDSLSLGISYLSITDFYEKITGRIPLRVIDKDWFLSALNLGNRRWFDLFKRIYDLILSIFFLILSLPFWLIIAFLIKIDSPGTIFFSQARCGKNGKIFYLYKFRTMFASKNDLSLTLPGDSRITRVGRFLRGLRIDELPQLINILKNEMSFVGPRPERPEFVENFKKEIPFYNERTLVKPGLTGWDQISEYHSASLEDTFKKLQYDLFYIKNRSLYLDLSIILKTVKMVLSQKGI